MGRIEMKICRECKTMYRRENGSIIMTPQDHVDMGVCEKCRRKKNGESNRENNWDKSMSTIQRVELDNKRRCAYFVK